MFLSFIDRFLVTKSIMFQDLYDIKFKIFTIQKNLTPPQNKTKNQTQTPAFYPCHLAGNAAILNIKAVLPTYQNFMKHFRHGITLLKVSV